MAAEINRKRGETGGVEQFSRVRPRSSRNGCKPHVAGHLGVIFPEQGED